MPPDGEEQQQRELRQAPEISDKVSSPVGQGQLVTSLWEQQLRSRHYLGSLYYDQLTHLYCCFASNSENIDGPIYDPGTVGQIVSDLVTSVSCFT